MEKKYRYDLDLLKGLAIISVVLYHAGWCKSGYLGVDLFLVLNGSLVIPKVLLIVLTLLSLLLFLLPIDSIGDKYYLLPYRYFEIAIGGLVAIQSRKSRIRQSDRIYYFGWKHDVLETVWIILKLETDIWGIGTKNHGTSNGVFYKNLRLTLEPDSTVSFFTPDRHFITYDGKHLTPSSACCYALVSESLLKWSGDYRGH